jgi:hypothetical protein
VVVKPALAVPYFTGIAAFVGNIVSLSASMQKWQETVVNKVLEELQPLLDRFKPQLLELIEAILIQVRDARKLTESSPFAGIPGEKLKGIEDNLMKVYCSIETNDLKTIASVAEDAKNEAQSDLTKLIELKKDAKKKMESGLAGTSSMFRTLSEQEITSLLRSLWSSIRSLPPPPAISIPPAALCSRMFSGRNLACPYATSSSCCSPPPSSSASSSSLFLSASAFFRTGKILSPQSSMPV